MKERKLNFLLALLAALALVFAFAGCAEDGADGADGEDGAPGADGAVTDYSNTTYNLTLDAIWLDDSHTATDSSTVYYLGMVTLEFSGRGTGVSFIVDYASCTYYADSHASAAAWTAYNSTSTYGDIHYQAEIGDAYYFVTNNGVAVYLPGGTNGNTALTLYFTASEDKSTLTLTGTDASSGTAEYKVLGDLSTADALGNTISNGDATAESNSDSTAKDIFSTTAFGGNTDVLANDGSSVFTKVQ